jgi:hypothetical protein
MAGVYRPRHPERTVLYRVLFHVRYYSLYANAHRGKVRKAGRNPFALRMVEEELKPVPSKGWAALIRKPHLGLRSAAMIRKVYEVDPLICPKCGSLAVLMEQRQRLHECGQMKVIAFITDYQAVDLIIDHLKLVFVAEKPPPSGVFEQVALIEAEERAEYF